MVQKPRERRAMPMIHFWVGSADREDGVFLVPIDRVGRACLGVGHIRQRMLSGIPSAIRLASLPHFDSANLCTRWLRAAGGLLPPWPGSH